MKTLAAFALLDTSSDPSEGSPATRHGMGQAQAEVS